MRLLETAGARLQQEMDEYDEMRPLQTRGALFPMDKVFTTLAEAVPLTSSPVRCVFLELLRFLANLARCGAVGNENDRGEKCPSFVIECRITMEFIR